MKTSIFFYLLISLLTGGYASAQQDFFYVHGKKVHLQYSDKITLKFKNTVIQSQIDSLWAAEPDLGDSTPMNDLPSKGFKRLKSRTRII